MKFISIKRTVNKDTTTSTLVMQKEKLAVLGNLPHGAEISLDTVNAQKLYDWLRKNYEVHE